MSPYRLTPLMCSVLLAACAGSPALRWHQLELPAARPLAAHGPALLVGPVEVPEAVDRPQFVLTEAGAQLIVRDELRWAQSYKNEFNRALAAHLAERLNSARILPYGTAGIEAPRLHVSLLRVQTHSDGDVLIEAVCSLQGAGRPAMIHRTTLRQRGGTDAAALVASHSSLAARLAEELIAAWPQLAKP